MGSNRRILLELYSYPSYMVLTPSEIGVIFDSFLNIFKSIFASLKLLTNTLLLNLKVIAGTAKNDREMISNAFDTFEKQRRQYDRDTAEHLKYFKEFYMDSNLENLGGFGPKVMAFAANPVVYFGTERAAATVRRGTGQDDPYSVPRTKRSGVDTSSGRGEWGGGGSRPASPAPSRSRITPRVASALDFFRFEGGRLSEAAEKLQLPPEAQKEMKELNAIAQSYLRSETKNAELILDQLGARADAMRKIVDSMTFEELMSAMDEAKRAGIKMFDSGIRSAHEKIVAEFEKQREEDPEKFKQAVKKMRARAPEIKETDDLEVAMKFVFGVTKSQIQRQLISTYDEFISQARASMNLPIDNETKNKLTLTELGRQYLSMLNNFDRQLTTGQKQFEQEK